MRTLAADLHGDKDEDHRSGWCFKAYDHRYQPLGWLERRSSAGRHGLQPEFRVFPSRRATFDVLVSQWRRKAAHQSVTYRVAMLPAYQQMIGLGIDVVPLILGRLRTDPSPHWFWALRALAREDPASDDETVEEAVSSWLRWGKSEGFIPD